jgi:hypothetical protein
LNSAKLNDWLQVIGLFGVIGSLIFVGLQMKQDREIALSAATQARTDTTIDSILGAVSNPYHLSAIDKIAAGRIEDLTPSERWVLTGLARTALFNLENVHYQYQQGFIPEDRWDASRKTLKQLLRRRLHARAAFEENPDAWRASFRAVVQEAIIEIDAEDLGQ